MSKEYSWVQNLNLIKECILESLSVLKKARFYITINSNLG